MTRRVTRAADRVAAWSDPGPSHPDLEEARRSYSVAHTSNGRFLRGTHLASAPTFTDPRGWTPHASFSPSPLARQGATAYASLMGMGDPHSGAVNYASARREPEELRRTAKAYDALPAFDPNAVKHFDAVRRGVNSQYDFMTKRLGIKVQPTDYDPYPDVHAMVNDVNNNKTLKVLSTAATGGHPYFDDQTNDRFRAMHDFFGHAATGRSFDRHGEEAAYLAHAAMFHPQARPALNTELRGQNSSLIYNGGFAPQKIATLPNQL